MEEKQEENKSREFLGLEAGIYAIYKETNISISKRSRKKQYDRIIRKCIYVGVDQVVCNQEISRSRDAKLHLKKHVDKWSGM